MFEPEGFAFRCECGAPLKSSVDWQAMDIDTSKHGLRRYASMLPGMDWDHSLGEGWTPMLAGGEKNLHYKLEFMAPTGSFKDRGSVMVLGEAKRRGAESVVVDSSGNAGASVAAYAAACGIKATVVVPRDSPDWKQEHIAAFGAELKVAGGNRSLAASMAMEMAKSVFYASHVWNPFFLEGVKTIAFEIWEQMGKTPPDAVVVPVGNGTLLLGLLKGFREMLQRVKINRLPRLIAVQSERCAPLYAVWNEEKREQKQTVADGIAVSTPPRIREMVDAIRVTRGDVVLVSDEDIMEERKRLATQSGLLVEPTGAVASAAVNKLRAEGVLQEKETTVVPLTGSGLKTPR
ncbi:MAG: pyridoxal-phosphate dependent enzyme [Synergistota bacterium]|nr:pyridoxal-phosphate dependent enzyme [Synergistota bacterium]